MAETPRSGTRARKGRNRKLVLNRQTLRKLEAGEMRQVVGGGVTNGACDRSHPHFACGSVDGC